jgi:hypothetical protein
LQAPTDPTGDLATDSPTPPASEPVTKAASLLPGEPEAIFVVGTGRSGTTLMRTQLELSPRIAIARENHFLGHLRAAEGARYYFRRAGDLADDATIRRIVAMLYEGDFRRQSRLRELSPFWRWLVANVPRAELEQRLLAAERSERGLMTAFMRVYADWRGGRPIMGEKTPAHLAYVDTLLDWFPTARVIHMMRDPRAVYVSDLRRRRNKLRRPYSWLALMPGLLALTVLVQDSVVWRAAERFHRQWAEAYPDRYRLVRFEDLVSSPEPTLQRLYDFLGVELPVDALNVKVVSQGFQAGEHGFDAGAATRWRRHINPFARRWLELFLRAPMHRLGYSSSAR